MGYKKVVRVNDCCPVHGKAGSFSSKKKCTCVDLSETALRFHVKADPLLSCLPVSGDVSVVFSGELAKAVKNKERMYNEDIANALADLFEGSEIIPRLERRKK